MFRVTRTYRFPASHRLHAPQLSEEENRAIYGKCNNPFGHGHNYVLEVTARGPRTIPPPAASWTLRPLRRFGAAAGAHAVLPSQPERGCGGVPGRVPTSENLAVEICRRLRELARRYSRENGPNSTASASPRPPATSLR